MSVDKRAVVFDLADALPWLGIELLGNAVKLMTRHFKEGDYNFEEVFVPKDKNPKDGRAGKRYMISLDIFEDLLMLTDTKQGKEARKMYKQLRDAVQDYMKMEMEASVEKAQQELEARTTELAIRGRGACSQNGGCRAGENEFGKSAKEFERGTFLSLRFLAV